MPGARSPFSVTILLIGFLLALGLMIGVSWLSVSQRQALAQVRHSLEVENRVRIVLSRLQDAETGQRGYLLTGRPEFLAPYRSAQAAMPGDIAALRRAVNDNAVQGVRIDRLRALIDRRQQMLDLTIALRQRGDPDAILSSTLGS